MGKKKIAHKQAPANPPKNTGGEHSETRPPTEERPPTSPPQPQAPTSQAPTMVQLDALAAFLQQQDPNKDWTAALADFGRTGGIPAMPAPTPEIPTTANPPTTIPTSLTPAPEKSSPTITAPSTSTITRPPSAYQDPTMGETEEKGSEEGRKSDGEKENEEEKQTDEGEEKSEEKSVERTTPRAEEREKLDLNETAIKQGLMTDEEFQSLLDGVNRMEVDNAEMAEGLDLASQVVGGGETPKRAEVSEDATHRPVEEMEEKQLEEERPKSVTPQSEAGVGDERQTKEERSEPFQPETGEGEEQSKEQNTEVPTVKQGEIAPPVIKPRVAKRRLVLKDDPKEERQKPKRVSQRCLGRWTSSKAGSNTAADAVEISSEEEKGTPTKPEEEPSTATDQEGASAPTEMVSPTPGDQMEETTEMAEGLDLASRVAEMNLPINDDTIVCLITEPTAQKEPSTSERKKPREDEEEDRYLQGREMEIGAEDRYLQQSNKKQRTVNTGVVIREPEQRTQPHQQPQSDSEYTSSDESESESDVTLEDEEYYEHELPGNHHELIYPPVDR